MKLILDIQGAQSESRFRGIGRHTRSLARAIVERGGDHEISVLLNSRLSSHTPDLTAEFNHLLPAEHVLTFNIAGPVAEADRTNLWRMRAAELLREAFVAKLQPDLVHVGSLFEGFLDDTVTSVGALASGSDTAVTLYDLIPLLNPEKYLANLGPRRHYLRRAQALKSANLLLALSESARQEAIDNLHFEPDRIAVIRCGVDKSFRLLDISPMEQAILRRRFALPRSFIFYVGAIDPRKNVELLLKAYGMLPPELRAAHGLAFAGNLAAEEKGRLRAMRARYGIRADELAICGHINEEELVQLYNMCATFVFPSHHEGFGLPALEAMACGAPTLTSNTTSLPEVIGRNEMMFGPDNAAALAERLIAVLTDAGFRKDITAWGLKRSAEFTWSECARRALAAFENTHALNKQQATTHVALSRKKRLAFLSPLPNDQSGVADYSAELLRELGRYYDIDCIVDGTSVTDEWVLSNFSLRDVGWFERNADSYDRIFYCIGNSHFHAKMLGLLKRFPGVVLLHDFYLGDLIDWMSNTGKLPDEAFFQELYLTHGLSGLLVERDDGRLKSVQTMACNGGVFRNATGVITHSQYAITSAEELFGPSVTRSIAKVPFLRAGQPVQDRAEARKRLGFTQNEFVVCSFGIITRRKLSQDLLGAWTASSLNDDKSAALVFVGETGDDAYGQELKHLITRRKAASRIAVTGHVSMQRYRDYLAAADLAVQLRTDSRGETSAAVLDCMAAGLPVIINANGTFAEIPDEVVHKIDDRFEIQALRGCLEYFYDHSDARQTLGKRARDHVVKHHHPAKVGQIIYDTVEKFSLRSENAQQQTLLSVLSDMNASVAPTHSDLEQVASAISRNGSKIGLKQLFCDVTVLADLDAKTGIQRVVRSILATLIKSPPAGFRIEPVVIDGNVYRYARAFTDRLFNVRSGVLPDAAVEYGEGDIFLGLDWVPDRLPNLQTWFRNFSSAGGRVVICVYDLLPLQLPQFFPEFMGPVTLNWFEAALAVADQFVCISRAVADDVRVFASALGDGRRGSVAIDYFHIGSDLDASIPTKGLADDASLVLTSLRARKSFLMVGTVEPRKGHLQIVEAFDELWNRGVDVCLVIVGKRGWMVDEVADLVQRHREFGKRLFWLQGISDEMLDLVYSSSSALIAASHGEGFGLPLIEAAGHHVPLIARGIPVFREIAGTHAFYFSGDTPLDVVLAIEEWLRLDASGSAPLPTNLAHLNWEQSTAQLKSVMFASEHYHQIDFGTDNQRGV